MLATEQAQRLLTADPDELRELMCRESLGYWTQEKMKLPMSPLHWEWCRIRQTEKRIAVIAPREHAKSETFTVNGTAWESVYTPGLWTYIFAQTFDQSKNMLQKVRNAVQISNPEMIANAIIDNKTTLQLSNYAKIECAGAGKATRGVHPDVIVGDDVLSDGSAATKKQRDDVRKWWFGAVGGASELTARLAWEELGVLLSADACIWSVRRSPTRPPDGHAEELSGASEVRRSSPDHSW
jgi:hypothetical protein